MAIWNIFCSCGIFMVFWYIYHRFGMLYQEKSGNPGTNKHTHVLYIRHSGVYLCKHG
jgi:hypothetical protein